MKLNLLIFYIWIIFLMSIRLSIADMIIEESIVFGMYLNRGVIINSVNNIIQDIIMLEVVV